MTTTTPAIDLAVHLTGRNENERVMIIAGLNAMYGIYLGIEPGEPLSAAELKRLALDWTSQATATRKRHWNSYMATLRAELDSSDEPRHIEYAVCQWGLIALCWALA